MWNKIFNLDDFLKVVFVIGMVEIKVPRLQQVQRRNFDSETMRNEF